jgi:hypothetical protein
MSDALDLWRRWLLMEAERKASAPANEGAAHG